MSDALRNQIKIAEQHYNSMPADLRSIYEAEYSVASAAYRRDLEAPAMPVNRDASGDRATKQTNE